MEFFIDITGLMSFIVCGYALAIFFLKFGESKEQYKRATEPMRSEYVMSVYRGKVKVLKPLLCTIIITGYIWTSIALYHVVT